MNDLYNIDGNISQNVTEDGDFLHTDNDFVYTLLAIMLSILSFVGTLGNIPVLIVFCKRKDKKASNTFIKILAFLDLLVCAFVMPYSVIYEYHLVTSDIACRLFEFLIHFAISASNITLVAIATERYIAVCKIGRKLNVTNINRGMYGILVLSVLIAAPSIGTFAVVDDSGVKDIPCSYPHERTSGRFCHFTFAVMGKELVKAYQIMQLFLFFIVLITIIVLYSIIYAVLRKKTKIRKSLTRHRESCITTEREVSVTENEQMVKREAKDLYSEQGNSNTANLQQNACSNHTPISSEVSKETQQGYSAAGLTASVDKDKSDSRVKFENRSNDSEVRSVCVKDSANAGPRLSENNIRQRVSIEAPDKIKPKRSYHRRTAKMLFLCTVIYFVTWMPFWIDIFGFTNSLLFRYVFFFGHATNPIVYGIVNKQVRVSFKRLFLNCLKLWCKGSRPSSTENVSFSGTSV